MFKFYVFLKCDMFKKLCCNVSSNLEGRAVFPGKAYLLNDTYLIRTYKIVNGEALKI